MISTTRFSSWIKSFRVIILLAFFLFVTRVALFAQWSQANGPEGGAIADLLLVGSDLYATTTNGGIYKSTDEAVNWSLVGTDIISKEGNKIIKSGVNVIAGSDGGPYLSGNSGVSWAYSNSGLVPASVSQLVVNGTDIYAATPSGVYISGNDGVNWSGVGLIDLSLDIEAVAINGAILWAGTDALYKSVNSGVNWAEVTNVGFTDTGINFVYVSGSNVIVQSSAKEGIKYSSDGGTSWSVVTGITEMITTISENAGTLYAGTNGGGIYTSIDNGASWSSFSSTGLDNDIITRILFSATTWYAGTGGGVYKSTDSGVNWTEMVSGMNAHTINALLTDGTDLYAGTAGGGIYKSADNGSSWAKVNSGIAGKNYMVFSLLKSGTNIYAGTFGGVVKSSNNGTSWVEKNTGLTLNFGIKSMVATNTNLFALDYFFTIYTSSDAGNNWSVAMGSGVNTFSGAPFALGSDGTNVYASGFFGDVAMKSSDAGANWLSSNTGITNSSGFNFATQFFYDGTSMYIATAEGMFRSDDSGSNWVGAGTGLPSDFVNDFTLDGSNLYVGTNGSGVYVTSNQGGNWSAENTNLGNQFITSLAASSLYAGTKGSGIWKAVSTVPELIGLNPDRNSLSFAVDGNISIRFNMDIDPATIINNISVTGSLSGLINYTLETSSADIILINPTNDLLPGEKVNITILKGLISSGGGTIANAISYSFSVKTNPKISNLVFKNGSQSNTRSVAAGDINGDGLVDYCTSNDTGGVYWYKNNGDETFEEINLTTITYILGQIHIADIDNDNDNDIIIASGGIHIFENDGAESFSITNVNSSNGQWFNNSQLVDLDADGDIDILGSNNSELYWFEQTLPLQFGVFHSLGSYNRILDLDVADIDFDGDLDIYTVFRNSSNTINKIIEFKNDGNKSFTSNDLVLDLSLSSVLKIADLELDGDLDFIVGGTDLVLLENTGSGFSKTVISSNVDVGTLEIRDLDGDLDIDIFTGTGSYKENGQVIYINDNNTFSTQLIPDLFYGLSVAIADFNDDKIMDIVVGSAGAQSTRLYLNAYTPRAPQAPVVSNETSSSLDISWIAPEDFGYPISEYVLEQKEDGGSFQVVSSGTTNLSYQSTGLSYSTNYTYRVKAINIIGESYYSSETLGSTPMREGTDFSTFSLNIPSSPAIIDNSTKKINLEVDYGTNLSALKANFTLSGGASVKVGTTVQESGITSNDFSNPVTYTVLAEDGVTSQDWVVTVSVAANTATDITAFSFTEQTGNSIIDTFNLVVNIEVVYGTDVTALIASFVLSPGATAQVATSTQISGTTPNDFSSLLTYKITAEDGVTIYDWTVMVSVKANTETDILSFSFPEQIGESVIDVLSKTVKVEMPFNTDVSALVATFTLSPDATAMANGVSQESGVSGNNFIVPVTYEITAGDLVTNQFWTVTVIVSPGDTATDIIAFSFTEQTSAATIDTTNKTVDIEVSYGTGLTSLIASFELSPGAIANIPGTGIEQISGTTLNDYTNPLTYTVIAEDGISTNNWVITVSVAKNTAAEITAFSFPEQTGSAVVDASNRLVEVEVANGTDVTSLVASFTLSDGASAVVGTILQVNQNTVNNFTNDVTYKITAEDGISIQDWTVSVTVALNSQTEMLAYSFPEQSQSAIINLSNKTIKIQVKLDTDVTNLVASFSLSDGATAEVNGIPQKSGETSNDFSNSVTYSVIAENGVAVQEWVVTIELVTGLLDDLYSTTQVGKVYPNPFNSMIQVPIHIKDANTTININLIDLNGKKVFYETIRDQSTGEFNYVLNMSKLKSKIDNGTYILRVEIVTKFNTDIYNQKVIYQLN